MYSPMDDERDKAARSADLFAECYECGEEELRSEMLQVERDGLTVMIHVGCRPKCNVCPAFATPGYECCVVHALEAAREWLSDLLEDETRKWDRVQEAQKDVELLQARMLLAKAEELRRAA